MFVEFYTFDGDSSVQAVFPFLLKNVIFCILIEKKNRKMPVFCVSKGTPCKRSKNSSFGGIFGTFSKNISCPTPENIAYFRSCGSNLFWPAKWTSSSRWKLLFSLLGDGFLRVRRAHIWWHFLLFGHHFHPLYTRMDIKNLLTLGRGPDPLYTRLEAPLGASSLVW